MASTSRSFKGKLGDIASHRAAHNTHGQATSSMMCHGNTSKEGNVTHRRSLHRQWPKPCGYFSHTSSNLLAGTIILAKQQWLAILKEGEIEDCTTVTVV
jgi:hypothetical protein